MSDVAPGLPHPCDSRPIAKGVTSKTEAQLSKMSKEPRYQYTRDRVRQRERRLHDQADEFKERYRWRAGIEGTMSRFKHQMHMAALRVRGRAAVGYTTFLRALGLNIHRVAVYKAAW